MSNLVDTRFLFALYFRQATSARAEVWPQNSNSPIQITSLARFEFFQAARQEIYLRQTGGQRGFTIETMLAAFGAFENDCEQHAVEIVSCDYEAVLARANELSDRFTSNEGYRSMDIFHVATAVEIGVTEFLTFDADQRRLAIASGLSVPLL